MLRTESLFKKPDLLIPVDSSAVSSFVYPQELS